MKCRRQEACLPQPPSPNRIGLDVRLSSNQEAWQLHLASVLCADAQAASTQTLPHCRWSLVLLS